jgi:hypothetical protein
LKEKGEPAGLLAVLEAWTPVDCDSSAERYPGKKIAKSLGGGGAKDFLTESDKRRA